MSLPQPNPTAVEARDYAAGEFAPDERAVLLRLAHESILSALEGRDIPLDPPTDHLAEPRGAFTTLHLGGQLRGCVGYVLPVSPVYRAVADTARAAAFEDTRFHPVTLPEASQLEIELSILSPPLPIAAESVEIGRHGLLIGMAGKRGLLLPQVPTEHHWDRITFLEQTCRKAGLPLDAWKNGATIEAFTAEIFGDKRSSN
ncbi:MAG TPA: AmmeMemoRadiSam system protein A [Candidatus Sulfotelmatobacter sp.]|nr:AmmeMemoRadiSam system protein A [Candidatus Sulfotelmatobacter sp.]